MTMSAASRLKELRTFVQKHELKICDTREEMNNATDQKERSEANKKLRKLEKDAKWKDALKEIDELEDKERQAAQTTAPTANGANNGYPDTAASKGKKPSVVGNKATGPTEVNATEEGIVSHVLASVDAGDKDKTQARCLRQAVSEFPVEKLALLPLSNEIDRGLFGTAPAQKIGALRCLKALAFVGPLVLPRLQRVLQLCGDSKAGAAAKEAAASIVAEVPTASIPIGVLPILRPFVEDRKKWKISVPALNCLTTVMERMASFPKQLARVLAELIPILITASKEIRNEVREAAKGVLHSVGRSIANPEIRALSDCIIAAVVDPTNQKLTQDALIQLSSTTFMNYVMKPFKNLHCLQDTVDANALSVLCPILIRALNERDQKSLKWASQILGSTVKLVQDIDFIRPYFGKIIPQLKNTLSDPAPEVQREAAKAIAEFCFAIPDVEADMIPHLTNLLASTDESGRVGAAMTFAQIHFLRGKDSLGALLTSTYSGCANATNPRLRHANMVLLDLLAGLFKEDYAAHVLPTFTVLLRGCLDADDTARKAADDGVSSMISFFTPLCPELLFPAIRDAYLISDHPEDRFVYVNWLLVFATRVMDFKKYQQDVLAVEVGAPQTRKEIGTLVYFVLKGDQDAKCARTINNCWKTIGGHPKLIRGVLGNIAGLFEGIKDINNGFWNKSIGAVRSDIVDTQVGFTAEEIDDAPKEVPALLKPVSLVPSSRVASSADLSTMADDATKSADAITLGGSGSKQAVEIEEKTKAVFDQHISGLEGDAKEYAQNVAIGVFLEGGSIFTMVKKLKGGFAIVQPSPDSESLKKLILAVLPDAAMHTDVRGTDADAEKVLLEVDNMMLMYGGGHLLLKDTILKMFRGHRYGVVGHNGCGKTTLMKQLVSGKVAGMPSDLKVVHVSDMELSNLKIMETQSRAYLAQDAPPGSNIDEALEDVGFPQDMCDKLVSDLSGGWRMRLLLARAMMKNADLLLLDEPTNHLDVQAIEWLTKYLKNQKDSSMMVISHEQQFLDEICSDIIQYKDKKLHYFSGNFSSFKRSINLGEHDVEAFLKGDINLDTEEMKESEAESDAAKIDMAAAPTLGKTKMTFPIPGKLAGVSSNKPVISMKNVFFRYDNDKEMVLNGIDCKVTLSSRIAIVGRNGAGKSTLMSLLCRELNAIEVEGQVGEVWRHHNLRLAYISQHHMESLGKFYDKTPYQYLLYRFQNGYDELLQKRLLTPRDEEEAATRKALAKKYGKYGLQVANIVSRSQKGKTILYEVEWEGLTDSKQNTMEPLSKLRAMNIDKYAIACDERLQAQAAGDQRQLTHRECVKHLEQFGIDEEMVLNQNHTTINTKDKNTKTHKTY